MALNPVYLPVEAPALQPPRMGLVRSAVEVDGGETAGQTREAPLDGARQPEWVGGFTYEPQTCAVLDPIPIGCWVDPEDGPTKDPGDNPENAQYAPFAVLGIDRCSAMDRNRDRLARARAQLLATESFQIAREAWDGAVARAETWPNAYLASAATTKVTGDTATPYVTALAEMEQALAGCLHGARGMIHVTPFTATLWQEAGLVRTESGVLLTALDTIVVADAGYSGSAPGAPPTPPADISAGAWIYGTGLVHLRRGPLIEVGSEAEQTDWSRNTTTVIVERAAAAYWSPCCQLGVNVDHTAALPS